VTQSMPASPPNTTPTESATPHHSHGMLELSPETFWAVLLRRTRYVVAIGVSALLFCTIGWNFVAPHPAMEGVSLMVWQNGLVGGLVLAALLLVTTAICSALVHPDSPPRGLFCALLGMAGIAIKGGSIHMLIQYAQEPALHTPLPAMSYQKLGQLLAIECVQWAFLFLVAEVFARLLHDRIFANTRWIERSGPELARDMLQTTRPGAAAIGVSLAVSRTLRTDKMRRRVATPLAMAYSTGLALVMLYVLMQSELKGQVLMACFVSFFVSTLLAYLAFPRVPILALLLTVPLTAAIGYLYGMGRPPLYPGHPGFYTMRALPIDYITAGIPGAILGYYGAFHWSLHSPEE
jgi:hypothetical protein